MCRCWKTRRSIRQRNDNAEERPQLLHTNRDLTDLKHHRKVAVKVLRPGLAAVLGAERFLREITIAANLSHPGILPVLDSGSRGAAGAV